MPQTGPAEQMLMPRIPVEEPTDEATSPHVPPDQVRPDDPWEPPPPAREREKPAFGAPDTEGPASGVDQAQVAPL